MPNRKADLTVRSGRIKNVTADQAVILTQDQEVQYRFFNTGKQDLIVTATKASETRTVTVTKQCSADLLLLDDAKVTISGTPQGKIEGVYDRVTQGTLIRSGRFRARNPKTKPIPIILAKPHDIYRVYNVGDNHFTVNGMLVPPSSSMDFALELDLGSEIITVTVTRDDDLPVAGLYDKLLYGAGKRSGHFTLDEDTAATPFPELKHLLVDATHADRPMCYRVTNTGNRPFPVNGILANGNSTPIQQLKTDQSIDVVVGSGARYKKLEITRTDKTHLMTGTYDFLGIE